MDLSRRREINRLADRIRSALDLGDMDVDVDKAVARLGGTIETTDVGSFEASVRKYGDAFRITLQQQTAVRRRFSVAHELGHLFIHMGYLVDPARWASIDEYIDSPRFRFGHSEEEYEAHEFAGAFLMPQERYRALVEAHTMNRTVNLAPIAAAFNVSTDAARVRGRWLGLLEWGK